MSNETLGVFVIALCWFTLLDFTVLSVSTKSRSTHFEYKTVGRKKRAQLCICSISLCCSVSFVLFAEQCRKQNVSAHSPPYTLPALSIFSTYVQFRQCTFSVRYPLLANNDSF